MNELLIGAAILAAVLALFWIIEAWAEMNHMLNDIESLPDETSERIELD